MVKTRHAVRATDFAFRVRRFPLPLACVYLDAGEHNANLVSTDLLAVFLPKFLVLARCRIARGIELATERSPDRVPAIARELHAIGGEAGLLGLATIVSLARSGEVHANRLRSSGSDADADALVAVLTELKHEIERVAPRAEANR